MQVFAILPAAGVGTRMGAAQPKQFLELNGLPILIHSLRAFAAVPRVTAIYVAVRANEVERVQAQVADHGDAFGFGNRVHVVTGGDNRQESVTHALDVLPSDEDDIVLVHDAVRPLIDTATIERTIDAVVEHGAAIVGLPAIDTVKQVERTAHGALVTSTIPRDSGMGCCSGPLPRQRRMGLWVPTRRLWWSEPDIRSLWWRVLRLI
jgi:2-C-methyl-D-erythritol 4-phosphate cytidylyltransferase